jgi:hypothetical protein
MVLVFNQFSLHLESVWLLVMCGRRIGYHCEDYYGIITTRLRRFNQSGISLHLLQASH